MIGLPDFNVSQCNGLSHTYCSYNSTTPSKVTHNEPFQRATPTDSSGGKFLARHCSLHLTWGDNLCRGMTMLGFGFTSTCKYLFQFSILSKSLFCHFLALRLPFLSFSV